AVMAGLTQIDRTYPIIGHHVLRRASHQDCSANEYSHVARELSHYLHVMLDHQNGDLLRQLVDHVEQLSGLATGNSSGWLVEHQNLWLQTQCQCDFHQPLPAVGDLRNLAMPVIVKTERADHLLCALHDVAMMRRCT